MSELIIAPEWVRHDGGRRESGFKGEAGDCVVRAIAIAMERPYRDVYEDLAELCGQTTYRGKRLRRSARDGVPKIVYHPYLLSAGWEWEPCMQIGQVERRHLRVGEMPSGRAVLRLSKHMAASVDGVVYDTYDPCRGGTRLLYGFYRPAVSSVDERVPLARVRADGVAAGVLRPRTL